MASDCIFCTRIFKQYSWENYRIYCSRRIPILPLPWLGYCSI